MKKILFFLPTLLFFQLVKAQIILENSYPTTEFYLVHLNNSGYKYVAFDFSTNEVTLYNLNHSVFKIINVPLPANTYVLWYISESIFDTDSGVEYLAYYGEMGMGCVQKITIFNEDGTVVFERDSLCYLDGFGPTYENFELVVPTDSGTKLILHRVSGHEVYSLPGALTCNECIEGHQGNLVPVIDAHMNRGLPNPFPNPSSNTVQIPYQLPPGVHQGEIVIYDLNGNELRRYKVSDAFSYITISTFDLASGTYNYKMIYSNGVIGGKKIVVIK